MSRIAWVTSWTKKCGIADYSRALLGAIEDYSLCKFDVISLDEFQSAARVVNQLKYLRPDIIHFQHEYGLFGGKNPPFYWFPGLVKKIRKALPSAKLVATAHTVLNSNTRFPVEGRGWQIPLRVGANAFCLPFLRKYWGPKTWSNLDKVIVHSKHQVEAIQSSDGKDIEVIPHFVYPTFEVTSEMPNPRIIVFGFISPEKGQDVVIEAMPKVLIKVPEAKLIIGGGVRRKADQRYFDYCRGLVEKLRLENSVEFTGYLPQEQLALTLGQGQVVVAPFHETSGSGSLARAFAAGACLIASDLPLNREITERVPDSMILFEKSNSQSAAEQIIRSLEDRNLRLRTREQGRIYAERFSIEKIAGLHRALYNSIS